MAYINYPNPHATIHTDLGCASIRRQDKDGQRILHLRADTLSSELEKIAAGGYRFGATAETNDMWLKVDFDDAEFELAVVQHVIRMLGRRYAPLARVTPQTHC